MFPFDLTTTVIQGAFPYWCLGFLFDKIWIKTKLFKTFNYYKLLSDSSNEQRKLH